MPFEFEHLEIPGVVLIKPKAFVDQRGFFMETYKKSDFVTAGICDDFVQDNHSRSARKTLRGLHYQEPPRAQGKLVRVITGEVFDVAVDIRAGSPTYGKWIGLILSAGNRHMLYVPPGCAHGFCVLSEQADLIYKTTEEFSPGFERGIVWNDPDIAIDWPVKEPTLSIKDAHLPLFRDIGRDFEYEGSHR